MRLYSNIPMYACEVQVVFLSTWEHNLVVYAVGCMCMPLKGGA